MKFKILTKRSEVTKKVYASALITATTSVHLPKSVLVNLTVKSDSDLTSPIAKGGVRDWSM